MVRIMAPSGSSGDWRALHARPDVPVHTEAIEIQPGTDAMC